MAESKKNRPRICDVLGVEVGEIFYVCNEEDGLNSVDMQVTENGRISVVGKDASNIVYSVILPYAINNPDSVIRRQRLTQDELAICNLLDAKWISRDEPEGLAEEVILWDHEPFIDKTFDGQAMYGEGDETWLAKIDLKFFPSVKPGALIDICAIAHT